MYVSTRSAAPDATNDYHLVLAAETKQKTLSPFLSVAKSYPMFFVPRLHPITVKTRAELAKVLHRNPVDEGDAKIIIKQ